MNCCSLTKHHLSFSQILVGTRPAIRTKLQFQVVERSATQNPLQYSWHIMSDPQASTSTSTLGHCERPMLRSMPLWPWSTSTLPTSCYVAKALLRLLLPYLCVYVVVAGVLLELTFSSFFPFSCSLFF